jgi:hypothetical protein
MRSTRPGGRAFRMAETPNLPLLELVEWMDIGLEWNKGGCDTVSNLLTSNEREGAWADIPWDR